MQIAFSGDGANGVVVLVGDKSRSIVVENQILSAFHSTWKFDDAFGCGESGFFDITIAGNAKS